MTGLRNITGLPVSWLTAIGEAALKPHLPVTLITLMIQCTQVCSRLQKVGIWAWDSYGWFCFFSRLWGWARVIFQLSGLQGIWTAGYFKVEGIVFMVLVGYLIISWVLGPSGITYSLVVSTL